MSKRYYWIKLQRDFFDALPVKRLRQISGGDTFVIIYMKMILASIETDGLIEFQGLCDNFAAELALALGEREDDVQLTLAFLIKNGLAESGNGQQLLLPYTVDNTGSEAESTRRWRKWNQQKPQKTLESNKEPTQPQLSSNIEKEIEQDKKEHPPYNPPKGGKRDRVHRDAPEWEPEQFARLWLWYPHDKRGNKQRAIRAWDGLHPTVELIDTIFRALDAQSRTDEWDRGVGIPHLSTYLNGYGWEGWDDSTQPRWETKLAGLTGTQWI